MNIWLSDQLTCNQFSLSFDKFQDELARGIRPTKSFTQCFSGCKTTWHPIRKIGGILSTKPLVHLTVKTDHYNLHLDTTGLVPSCLWRCQLLSQASSFFALLLSPDMPMTLVRFVGRYLSTYNTKYLSR